MPSRNALSRNRRVSSGFSYDKADKQLVINQAEAAIVRYIFDMYQLLGEIRAVHELCPAHVAAQWEAA